MKKFYILLCLNARLIYSKEIKIPFVEKGLVPFSSMRGAEREPAFERGTSPLSTKSRASMNNDRLVIFMLDKPLRVLYIFKSDQRVIFRFDEIMDR